MYEPEFDEILEEATRRMRKWSRSYYCQDINHRHGIDYWVYEITKEKYNGTESEAR